MQIKFDNKVKLNRVNMLLQTYRNQEMEGTIKKFLLLKNKILKTKMRKNKFLSIFGNCPKQHWHPHLSVLIRIMLIFFSIL
jgi:hypothetical protein